MIKRSLSQIIALILVMVLIIGLFAGCSGSKQTKNTGSNDSQTSGNTQQPSKGPEPITLPIVKEPLKLTVFSPLDSKSAVVVKSYGEVEAFKELEKRTGITIEWQHPPVGQEKEQFNLMLASQQFPDMIYYNWITGMTGGPEKAIQDGVILKLNDFITKYAPNISKIFEKYPEARKQSMTDSGSFYMFPMMRGILFEKKTAYMNNFLSPQMRKDWLDKLGLQPPTTIDEWEKVLIAFKEKDPNNNGKTDEIPFVSNKDSGLRYLAAAWGILYDFYMDGGKIKYGPIEPVFKDYVAKLEDWYSKGLIDPDYLATDGKNFNSKVTDQIGGAYIGAGGGNFLFFTKSMKDKDPNFKLTAVPWPKGPAGKPFTAQTGVINIVEGNGLAISAKSKYITECVKWADNLYSDESITLMNWGIENESYKVENGKKVFTEAILKDPNGLDIDSALLKYATGGVSGWATVQAADRYEYNITDAQPILQDYFKVSGASLPDLILPPISPTSEESAKFASIMNEVNTYRDEMFNKFIMGQAPLEDFGKFVQTIKGMGIDEALKIQNAALERYNNRK